MEYSQKLLDEIIKDLNLNLNSKMKAEFHYSFFHNFKELSDNFFDQLVSQNPKILMISDENCYEILSVNLLIKLQKMNLRCEIHIMNSENSDFKNDKLSPTLNNANKISKLAQKFDLICAVGSGVVNDLCKKAAFEVNLDYIIFPTAASMNGYASSGASLINQSGFKLSYQCQMPEAIFFHLPTLLEAPMSLTIAGVADLMSYRTCYADWLLSNILFNTPYIGKIYEWMNNLSFELKSLVQIISGKNYQEREFAIQQLCILLLINGFSMVYAGGSHPCSQGEHMMAHLIESQNHEFAKQSHGLQIAQTSNFMNFLQKKIYIMDKLELSIDNYKFPKFLSGLQLDQARYYKQIHKIKLEKIQNLDEQGFNFVNFKKEFKNKFMTKEKDLICDFIEREFAINVAGRELLKINNIKDLIKATHATRDRMGFLDIAVASGQIDHLLNEFFNF